MARKERSERDGPWDLVLNWPGWDSPALLQLVVHRPVNAKGEELRGSWSSANPQPPVTVQLQTQLISVPSKPFVKARAHLGHQTPGSDKSNQTHNQKDTGHLPRYFRGLPPTPSTARQDRQDRCDT